MIDILVVFGTRPEAIKMAPVIRQLRRYPELFRSRICVTAQHRQMLDQVLSLFDIVPDVDLDLMEEGQTPTQVAAWVLRRMEPLLEIERPDWVLVQGDTTTVMAVAIAAHYQGIKVGHVEAGLRSFDRANPFPEEMNRVLADHVSDLHFAPTERARWNLLHEGIAEERVHVTGNTVVDALVDVASRPWNPPPGSPLAGLCDLELDEANWKLVLVTAHRRENFGRPLGEICAALKELVQRDGVRLAYPVHLNPNVWDVVHAQLGGVPRITLLPPLGYQELIYLMKRCTLVLTDSGGLQEEAPSLGKPVLVLREVTERPEAVEAGAARVVGTRRETIVAETFRLLDDPTAYAAMAQAGNPYGDGHAAERIVELLMARESG